MNDLIIFSRRPNTTKPRTRDKGHPHTTGSVTVQYARHPPINDDDTTFSRNISESDRVPTQHNHRTIWTYRLQQNLPLLISCPSSEVSLGNFISTPDFFTSAVAPTLDLHCSVARISRALNSHTFVKDLHTSLHTFPITVRPLDAHIELSSFPYQQIPPTFARVLFG